MPTSHVYLSYIARANSLHPRKEWNVWDFGIAADNSINACFWLSVVAGLSRMSEHYASSDTELSALLQDAQALKEVSLETLRVESCPVSGNDLLGKLARRLRIILCLARTVICSRKRMSADGHRPLRTSSKNMISRRPSAIMYIGFAGLLIVSTRMSLCCQQLLRC